MREMKDSGVQWLGMIPKAWDLDKIVSLYSERSTKVSDRDYPALSVTKQGIVPQLESAAKTDNGNNRKLIKKNDFVINSRSDRRGSCGISEYEGSCSLINTVLAPKNNMINQYYNYLFKTELFADEFYKWGNGIVDDLWSTKWSGMKNIMVPFPPLEDQRVIVDYLDIKCTQIDTIIAKEQAVIEKVQEYRQSIITETVVRGLSTNDLFKPINCEWIDRIPNGWNLIKFGMITTIKSNLVSPLDYPNLLQISPENIEKDTGNIFGIKTVRETGIISDNHLFNKGQIIYSKVRPTLNKVIIADFDGLCSADMYPIETIVNVKYLVYFMRSKLFVSQVDRISSDRVKMPKINKMELKQLFCFIPSEEEQKRIVELLDSKCNKIDKVILEKQVLIDKLTEYKKSLIYEVVTGKKEVPHV